MLVRGSYDHRSTMEGLSCPVVITHGISLQGRIREQYGGRAISLVRIPRLRRVLIGRERFAICSFNQQNRAEI
jgi:hypothetical protein